MSAPDLEEQRQEEREYLDLIRWLARTDAELVKLVRQLGYEKAIAGLQDLLENPKSR